jgi:hypothetical protein
LKMASFFNSLSYTFTGFHLCFIQRPLLFT